MAAAALLVPAGEPSEVTEERGLGPRGKENRKRKQAFKSPGLWKRVLNSLSGPLKKCSFSYTSYDFI